MHALQVFAGFKTTPATLTIKLSKIANDLNASSKRYVNFKHSMLFLLNYVSAFKEVCEVHFIDFCALDLMTNVESCNVLPSSFKADNA